MSEKVEITGVYKSSVLKDAAEGMTLVEKKLLGFADSEEKKEAVRSFIEKMSDGSPEALGFDEMQAFFQKITTELSMGSLLGFFEVLERALGDDVFTELCSRSELNANRLAFFRRVVSMNFMFAPAFRARLNKTVQLSREWWDVSV